MSNMEHMLLAAAVLLDMCITEMDAEPEEYDPTDLLEAYRTVKAIAYNLKQK